MHCKGFVSQTSTHPLARLIQVRQERLPMRQPRSKYDCLKDKSNMQEQASICFKQDFQPVAQDLANQRIDYMGHHYCLPYWHNLIYA